MVIKSAIVCDKNREEKLDVRIKDGKIFEISKVIKEEQDEEIIYADGLYLLPSLIDLNTRVHDDALTINNLKKLSKECLKGGVGSVALMPDSTPPIESEAVVELVNTNKTEANIYPVIKAINRNLNLSDISILIKRGCKGIFADSDLNGNMLRRIFEYANMWKKPLFCRCEDSSLSSNGVINDGFLSAKMGLPGIPALSETKEVAKLCEVAIGTEAKIVIQAISSERSLQIINRSSFKEKIYSEISVHHLAITEDLCEKFNTSAKIKPPLKSDTTRRRLLEALKRGEVDLLTSLHSPKSVTRKDVAFELADFGIDAISDYFSILYTFLVKNSHINLQKLSELTSKNQAEVLGIEGKGLIEVGYIADLILVDLKPSRLIEDRFSPYYNYIFYGEVCKNIIEGRVVYSR